MKIYFVTGNENKFMEAKKIIPSLEKLDIELPEIQHIDPKIVIKEKLLEALKQCDGEVVAEDTSLRMDCLNVLPGTFIKWFESTIGNRGLYELATRLENNKAEAVCMAGYARSPDDMHFFEGCVNGRIVEPRGSSKDRKSVV